MNNGKQIVLGRNERGDTVKTKNLQREYVSLPFYIKDQLIMVLSFLIWVKEQRITRSQ
jgi:hypothetical protein